MLYSGIESRSIATDSLKVAYVNLRGILPKHPEINPLFWKWVAAGFLTKPILKKILNLEKLLIETEDFRGEIFEFRGGLGTIAFALLNLKGALDQKICKVNAFEYFQG